MKKVLAEYIPNDCDVYIDDVLVKGPKTTYDNEEAIPRMLSRPDQSGDYSREREHTPHYTRSVFFFLSSC